MSHHIVILTQSCHGRHPRSLLGVSSSAGRVPLEMWLKRKREDQESSEIGAEQLFECLKLEFNESSGRWRGNKNIKIKPETYNMTEGCCCWKKMSVHLEPDGSKQR